MCRQCRCLVVPSLMWAYAESRFVKSTFLHHFIYNVRRNEPCVHSSFFFWSLSSLSCWHFKHKQSRYGKIMHIFHSECTVSTCSLFCLFVRPERSQRYNLAGWITVLFLYLFLFLKSFTNQQWICNFIYPIKIINSESYCRKPCLNPMRQGMFSFVNLTFSQRDRDILNSGVSVSVITFRSWSSL